MSHILTILTSLSPGMGRRVALTLIVGTGNFSANVSATYPIGVERTEERKRRYCTKPRETNSLTERTTEKRVNKKEWKMNNGK